MSLVTVATGGLVRRMTPAAATVDVAAVLRAEQSCQVTDDGGTTWLLTHTGIRNVTAVPVVVDLFNQSPTEPSWVTGLCTRSARLI